jgi:hypothetical protein
MSKPIPRQRIVPQERAYTVALRRVGADAPGSLGAKISLANDLIHAMDQGIGSKAALRAFGDSVREQLCGIAVLRPTLRSTLAQNPELADALGCLMDLLADEPGELGGPIGQQNIGTGPANRGGRLHDDPLSL